MLDIKITLTITNELKTHLKFMFTMCFCIHENITKMHMHGPTILIVFED